MIDRLFRLENMLVIFPATLGVVAQKVDSTGAIGPPATIVGGVLTVVALIARLHYNDRADARREKVTTLEAQMTLLKDERDEYRRRNEIVVKRADIAELKLSERPSMVLLLEDSDDLALDLVRILRRAGHQVRRVKTVAECNLEFDAQPPDVLVFDLKLPDANGEVAYDHAMRSGVPFRAIVMSGECSESRIGKLRMIGLPTLTKPVEATVLLDLVANVHPGSRSDTHARSDRERTDAPGDRH